MSGTYDIGRAIPVSRDTETFAPADGFSAVRLHFPTHESYRDGYSGTRDYREKGRVGSERFGTYVDVGRDGDPSNDIWYDSPSAGGGRGSHERSSMAPPGSSSLPLAVSLVPAPRPENLSGGNSDSGSRDNGGGGRDSGNGGYNGGPWPTHTPPGSFGSGVPRGADRPDRSDSTSTPPSRSFRPDVPDPSSGGAGFVHNGGTTSRPPTTSGSSSGGFYSGKPVILDLDGDGIEVSISHPVSFDWDNDGYLERSSWIGADDGFLVIDLMADGSIGDGGDGRIDRGASSRSPSG